MDEIRTSINVIGDSISMNANDIITFNGAMQHKYDEQKSTNKIKMSIRTCGDAT